MNFDGTTSYTTCFRRAAWAYVIPIYQPSKHSNTKHKAVSRYLTIDPSPKNTHSIAITKTSLPNNPLVYLYPSLNTTNLPQQLSLTTQANTSKIHNVYHANLRNPRPRRNGPPAPPRKLHLAPTGRRHASATRMAPLSLVQRRGAVRGNPPAQVRSNRFSVPTASFLFHFWKICMLIDGL